ncbi:cytochrome P450 81F3-like [Bidens hawaiensis]|uniref:cytochrome P450 81F3-like n=1 Tax=Bidens hawaiensis TaxID=980011 RepID=UPI00404AC369
MVETNVFIFILSIIIIIYMITLKRTKSNLINVPPSPPSLPILGHLYLLKQPLHETLLTLSQKYGPLMMLRFGVRRAVIITSPSLVKECFTKTNDIALANRPLTPSAKHFNYDYTTMGAAPYSHLWRALRRVAASELLSATRLDATTHLREHEVKLMCKQIINKSSNKIDLKCWFRDLLNNITTMAIMGKRYHGDQINIGDLKQASEFRDMMDELFKLLHTQNIGDFVPVLGWLGVGGVEKRMTGLMKRVDKFLDEVIDERLRAGSGESGKSHHKRPELLSSFIMLIAGTETPYLTLEWSMTVLLNNPNAMQTIKNEINTHVGSDRLLQESDLGKLSYLQNVINESLRLYPTLPLLLPSEAFQDITIGGYSVPRGTMLMVNAWAIQRDPILWDEPEKFMPERFDRRDEDKYKMLAFGVGRRGCPGTNLGYCVLGLALGTLIQAFEWEKVSIEEIDMTAFYGLSMAKLEPLQAICKARSNMMSTII